MFQKRAEPTLDSVTVFGTYSKANHPRIIVLIEGLRLNGIEVTEVNVPIHSDPNTRALSSLSAAAAAFTLWRYLQAVSKLVRMRLLTRSASRVVLIPYLGILDVVVARLLYPTSFLVWDDLAPVSQTLRDRLIGDRRLIGVAKLIENVAVRSSSLVIYDTTEQWLNVACDRPSHRKAVIPVGADTVWHSAAHARHAISFGPQNYLSVIYFGTFVPLHGTAIFAEAIARCLARGDKLRVTLVGDGVGRKSADALLEPFADLIEWRTWVDAPTLAEMVASADLSLGIFGTTSKALKVVPNKVYQSIAAGTPVVTSDTAVQRRACGDAAFYVEPGNTTALGDCLRQMSINQDSLKVARRRIREVRGRYSPRVIGSEFVSQVEVNWRY